MIRKTMQWIANKYTEANATPFLFADREHVWLFNEPQCEQTVTVRCARWVSDHQRCCSIEGIVWERGSQPTQVVLVGEVEDLVSFKRQTLQEIADK